MQLLIVNFCKIVIVSISTILIITQFFYNDLSSLFWDLDVYVRAVRDYSHGQDPYRDDVALLFVYHPYVLEFFSLLNTLVSLRISLFVFYISSFSFFIFYIIIYLQNYLSMHPEVIRESFFWLMFPTLSFGVSSILAFKTGNITPYLHFLVLGVFLKYKTDEKLNNFNVFFVSTIIFSSLIKPYFLGYLALVFLVASFKKSLFVSFVCIFFVGMVWVSGAYVMPDLYINFMRALNSQILLKGDLGYSIPGLTSVVFGEGLGFFLHTVACFSMLIMFLIFIKNKSKYDVHFFISIFIVGITLLNPRMKVYDFPFAVLFSIIFLFFSSSSKIYFYMPITLGLIFAAFPEVSSFVVGDVVLEKYTLLHDYRYMQFFGLLILFGGWMLNFSRADFKNSL